MKFLSLIALSLIIMMSAISNAPTAAQEDSLSEFADSGSYGVGFVNLDVIDESRDNREILTTVWYPAIVDEVERSHLLPVYEAKADTSETYPLVIYSPGGRLRATDHLGIAPHLASYGFVVVSIDHQDPTNNLEFEFFETGFVNRPLDILYMIDYFDTLDEGLLAGVADASKTGVAGYSFGGGTTMMMGGAQIDVDGFSSQCETLTGEINNRFESYEQFCSQMDDIQAYYAQYAEIEADSWWPATTDSRIAAIMPQAPCLSGLMAEDSLASIEVPTLILSAALDKNCIYEYDARFYFDNINPDLVNMVSFMNAEHQTVFQDKPTRQLYHHLAVIYFSYHLKGDDSFAEYLTAEHIETLPDLMWE